MRTLQGKSILLGRSGFFVEHTYRLARDLPGEELPKTIRESET